jgi:8-oxo-dGTP diphosphatase
MHVITVVCGLILNTRNEILIARRIEGSHSGKWEFPGGKLEQDESLEDCLQRELKEELSITVDVANLFSKYQYMYPTFLMNLYCFTCSYNGEIIQLVDHDDYAWAKANELDKYSFVDGDEQLVEKIDSDSHLWDSLILKASSTEF